MKVKEIYEIANELAPKSLSDEMCAKYGCYDNSGILVDAGEEVTGILFSLDLSKGAVERAVKEGANLIITHHPAIYGKIGQIVQTDVLGQKLIDCIKRGISVISMHLNLDAAVGGIDESLMEGIRRAAGKTEGTGTRLIATQMPLTGGAYGRAYEVKEGTLGDLAESMKKVFRSNRVEVYGDSQRRVSRVASFCGAGADEGAIAFALQTGAEVMVSSDFKHHLLATAAEAGLSVVTLTHYASENYGYQKYYEKIGQRVKIPCVYHEDSNLL